MIKYLATLSQTINMEIFYAGTRVKGKSIGAISAKNFLVIFNPLFCSLFRVLTMEFSYCIQCQEKNTGKVGDFVQRIDTPRVAISPVFGSLVDLFAWMKKFGFEHTYTKDYPMGLTLKNREREIPGVEFIR